MNRLRNAWAALMGRTIYQPAPAIEVIEMREGDRLLVKTEHTLSAQQIGRIKEYFEPCLRGETRVAVLSEGLTLVVLRRGEERA